MAAEKVVYGQNSTSTNRKHTHDDNAAREVGLHYDVKLRRIAPYSSVLRHAAAIRELVRGEDTT